MKERPILFSAPMVRALLEGRKTQTRRVVKFPKWADSDAGVEFSGIDEGPAMLCKATGCFADIACRYGKPGDGVWVRETWREKPYSIDRQHPAIEYRASMKYEGSTPNGKALDAMVEARAPWKPSIYMPRWASRISREVTGVRVERLQEISEAESAAEGCPVTLINVTSPYAGVTGGGAIDARDHYRDLWDSINGAPIIERDDEGNEIGRTWVNWAANPWVWVIEFKRAST